MKENLEKLEEFQMAFNSIINENPTLISTEDYELRYKLMREENEEYLDACDEEDLVEVADALGDKLYILLGTIVAHGMQDIIQPVFDEIHRSNMSKLDEDGNPIVNGEDGVYDPTRPMGKVLKSDRYSEPNLKQFF